MSIRNRLDASLMSSNLLTRSGGTDILVFDQFTISIKEVAVKFICIKVLSNILMGASSSAESLPSMSFSIANSLTLMFSSVMPASNIFGG